MRRRGDDVVSEDGPTRLGVEEWLTAREAEGADLAPMLVASARLLAAQVDHDPGASQTWARFLEVVRELLAPEVEARQWHVTQRQLVEQIAIAGHDERWRASKYAEAKAAGMDPTGWTKVVPVSCVWGQHQWKRPDYWKTVRCKWCDEIQPRGEP